MTTYTSEPGTRLGGRYRLEDRIAAGSGWAAWKAIDETLARAVTVFTFVPGFPRVAEVVTAARAASRLTDPRLAQVFDVEDAWDRAYIVMEWAAGETLGDMLLNGPLDPSRATRMIAEAAAALSSAHAAGVAHMCLSPGSVRWSQTGEVKVVGLGIDAALSGVSADDPVLADTQGLGRLLYAAVTGHWPGADYPALPPAPASDGQPCSPRQVIAGVPLVLSDITCRAMQLRTRDGGDPVTMPDQLARALLAALPPAPVPPAPPRGSDVARYPSAPSRDPYWPDRADAAGQAHWSDGPGWSDGAGLSDGAGRPDGSDRSAGPGAAGRASGSARPRRAGGSARPGRAGRMADRSRRGRRRSPSGLRSRMSAVVVAVVGVLVLAAIAAFLWPSHSGPVASHPGKHPSTPATAAVTILSPVGAAGFDPLTSRKDDPDNEQTQYARYAIDGNPQTAWQSQWYKSPEFGGLKAGSGLIIDMGKPVRYSSVTVAFGPTPGADIKLLVGSSNVRSQANLDSMTTVHTASDVSGTETFHLTSPAMGQYLVIWFTNLPPKPGPHHWFMAQVFNVVIKGAG